MEPTRYVLGFLFDLEKNIVLLQRKSRPDWQKGFLNGVGGHIEPNEDCFTAMRREAREEIGLDIIWQQKALIHVGEDAVVYVFRTYINKAGLEMTREWSIANSDEPCELISWRNLTPNELINLKTRPDLLWLLPACTNDNMNHAIIHLVGKE
jgi:8-oxo-dGTP pyrophosphatase MutT (NUDIX family)